jgi:hypothetical protein
MINPLREVEINHFALRHPRVAPGMEGLRVGQITDIHLGRWVKPGHILELADYVNGHEPHVVALTGDYVGYSASDIEPCIEALDHLTAPTFAVLGNHDHWTSTEISREAFAATSIRLLSNESHLFEHRDIGVEIVGVDDHVTGNADVPRAFADVVSDRFCLTLNHVPSIGPACAEHGAHLILSGHTHGFQFNIPRVTHKIAETFGTEYFAGPYRIEQAFLYVSRGLGSASWPWRIRALPELTFFTLRSGDHPQLELLDVETITIEAR